MERHFLWCEKNSQHGGKLHESLCKAFNKHKVDPNLRKLILQGLVAAISDEPSKQDPLCQEKERRRKKKADMRKKEGGSRKKKQTGDRRKAKKERTRKHIAEQHKNKSCLGSQKK